MFIDKKKKKLMLLYLILTINSLEKIDNPPITKGYINTYRLSDLSSNFKTIDQLSNYLFSTVGISKPAADRFAKKMQFSKDGNLLEHTFSMTINPYNTEQRYVNRLSYYILSNKNSNGDIEIRVRRLKSYCTVKSVVITTTTKSFLWFEWDSDTKIAWRPLTSYEVNDIYGSIDSSAKYYLNYMIKD